MRGLYANPQIESGLTYGVRVTVHHPALDEPATATYVAASGGPTAMVRLDGTDALVNVPHEWIRRG